jgi:hypothetical protein
MENFIKTKRTGNCALSKRVLSVFIMIAVVFSMIPVVTASESETPNKVAAPFLMGGGGSGHIVTVVFVTETEGATIFYTLDGSEPATQSSLLFAEAFNITERTTIKAIAVKEGMEDSDVLEETFFTCCPIDGSPCPIRLMNGGGSTRPIAGAGGGGGSRTPAPDTPAPASEPESEFEPHEYTTGDALNILRYVAGLITLKPEQRARYDLNGNGEINTADALGILRIIAGIV